MPPLNGRVGAPAPRAPSCPTARRGRRTDARVSTSSARRHSSRSRVTRRCSPPLARLRAMDVPVRCTLYGAGRCRTSSNGRGRCSSCDDAVRVRRIRPAEPRCTMRIGSGRFAAIVLASRTAGEKMMEGVPSALLEAMALRRAGRGNRFGQRRRVARRSGCGSLVPPDDPGRAGRGALRRLSRSGRGRARARTRLRSRFARGTTCARRCASSRPRSNERIETVNIAVIGLGYIGLPTAALLARGGHRVYGYDANPQLRRSLQRGEVATTRCRCSEAVIEALASGRLHVVDGVPSVQARTFCAFRRRLTRASRTFATSKPPPRPSRRWPSAGLDPGAGIDRSAGRDRAHFRTRAERRR